MHIVSIDGNELNTYDMQKAYVSGNKMVALGGSVLLNQATTPGAKESGNGRQGQ